MNSLPQAPDSSPRSQKSRVLSVAILLGVLAALVAIGAIVVLSGGTMLSFLSSGQATQAELDAKAELTELGALVVMDPQRVHVNSVNLLTLKSPESVDRALELLPHLSGIKSLDASGTKIGDEHAAVLARLTGLRSLVLTNTAITDATIEAIAGLSELNTLHVVNTGITSASLPALSRLSSLKILDLSGTKVTSGFESLQKLPELNWLLVRGLTLDAAAIAAIGDCPALSRLTLGDAQVPEDAVTQLERARPQLAIDQ